MRKHPSNYTDLTGQRFGRLIVVARADDGNRKYRVQWKCVCDCGGAAVATTDNLKRGNTNSCGCYRNERRSESHTTHGMRATTEYTIWSNMVDRCTNPKNDSYKNYGGRGIVVCERWLKFENFYTDMGPRPESRSLERRKNDKGYEKGNCLWATTSEQALNRRSQKLLTIFGETKNEKLWASDTRCVVLYATFRRRITLGWNPEKALTTPSARKI